MGARPAEAGHGKWAIVVGVGLYDDRSIPAIPFCRKDACDLTAALRARKYEVICLTDEGEKGTGLVLPAAAGGSAAPDSGETTPAAATPDAAPTRENILQRAQAFLSDERITEGDLVVVYFSGHGFAAGDTAYLATRDADLKRLEETCIPVTWLRKQLEACRARQKVLVLDSCHSGVPPRFKAAAGVAPEKPKLPGQENAAGRIFAAASAESGMVTMASCRGSESSWQKGENSAFTAFLLQGLAQDADGNRDGQVGVTELNKYVHQRVTAYAKDMGVAQTPVFHSVGLEGDITLVDCPIPKVKSNTLLYVGGAAALGGVAVAVGGGGGGGESTPAPPSSTVSGYVYRTTQRSLLDRLSWLGRTRQNGPCLCIRPQSGAPQGFEAASAATVTVSGGAGTATNAEGFFSLSLAEGSYTLTASCDGYPSLTFTVQCSGGTSVQVTAGNSDIVPPVLVSASAPGSTTIDLVFNETLQGASVNLLANYAITPPLAVTAVQLLPDGRTIRLATADQKKDADYTVTVSNVQDAAGNPIGSTGNTATFKGKGDLPRVESASAVDSTHVDVVFSEAIQEGAAAVPGDFTISPALGVTAARLQEDGKTVRLTTAEQLGSRVYTLTATGILDTAGDSVGTSNWATFTGVGVAPKVLADRVRALNSTHVEVVFDEDVDTVTASLPGNYRLAPALAVNAAQPQADGVTVWLETPEQKGGQSYTLTVSGVKDRAGNAVDSGANSGGFTGICAPPQVGTARAADNTHVDVAFSEALDPASAQTAANYTIEPALAVAGVPVLVSPNTVRVPTAAQQEGTTYRVTVANVLDVAGNPVETANVTLFVGAGASGEVPLQVVSAAAVDSTHVDLRFSKGLDPATAAAAANYAIAPALAVGAAQLLGDGESVRLTTAAHAAGQSYTVTVTGVKDTGGKVIGATGNTATFTGGVVALRITGSAAQSSTSVRIDFNKALDASTAATSSRYSLSPSLVVVSAEVLAGNASVRLTTTEQRGGAEYTLTVTGVTDPEGGALAAGGNTAPFTGIGVAPGVVSATAAGSNRVDVLFSEAVKASGANTAANYAIAPELNVTAAQLQADGKTVRLTTDDQVGGTSYTVTVTNVTDLAGNPVGTPNSATFTGVAPSFMLLSAHGSDATHVDLRFSRALDASSVAPGGFAISPSLLVTAAQVLQDGVTVRLTTSEHGVGVAYTVTATGVKDSIGNPIAAPANTAEFQGLAPVVVLATVVDSTHVDVLFSAALDKASAETAGNYTLSPGLTVQSAALQADGKTVRLTVSEQTEGVTYTVTVTGVQDTEGHTVSSTGNHASFAGVGDAPRVASAAPVNERNVDVAFSEVVQKAEAEHLGSYVLAADDGGSLPGLISATLQSDGATVRLRTTAHTNGAKYTVTVSGLRDVAGNPLSTSDNSASYTGIGTPPKVVSAAAVDATHVSVVFDEFLILGPARSTANYAIDNGLTVSAAWREDDGQTVNLTTSPMVAGAGYTVTVTGVCDRAGNVIGDTDNTATFTGFDQVKLTAASVTQTGGTTGSCLGDYEYRVTYTHKENTAPAYVRITINKPDGSEMGTWDMAKLDGSDTTYNDGCVYRFKPSIFVGGLGTYSYTFTASDSSATAAPSTGTGPTVTALDPGRIVFESDRDGNSEIYVMTTDGTNPTRLTNTTGNDQSPVWSPDGSKIAFGSWRDGNSEIYVMNADGTNQTRLTNNTADDYTPAWSPDGSKIAFQSNRNGGWEIFVMSADGSGQTSLAPGFDPAWSPDGSKIAFDLRPGGVGGVYTMNADGSGQTLLAYTGGYSGNPAWSPDGNSIVFDSQVGGYAEISVMNADGSGQTLLTSGAAHNSEAVWSPDGKKLAFYSGRDGASYEMYAMNADGTSQIRLTNNSTNDIRPAWSAGPQTPSPYSAAATASASSISANGADTSTITVTVRDGGYQPFQGATVSFSTTLGSITSSATTDANGQATATLTAGTTAGTATVTATIPGGKSPTARTTLSLTDAARIAFESHRDGHWEVYVMNADGTGQTRPVLVGATSACPAWSPDGTRILSYSDSSGNYEIYVMDADGTGRTALTNNAGNDFTPAWSPDGRKIVFSSDRDSNSEIYVMNADGSGQTRLTSNTASDGDPVWSPDGSKIAFYSDRDGTTQIYVMNADGSSQTRLTSGTASNYCPDWSPDGSRLAFASTRDGGAYEIYVMNPDGSGLTRLTNNSAADITPAWSADGSRLLFASKRDGNFEIYVMNADGTGQTRLTSNTADDDEPRWSAGPQTPSAYSATAAASPTIISANGSATSTITVTVRDGGYRLLAGCTVNFSTTLGTLSASSAVTDANGRASLALTGTSTGTATVTAAAVGLKSPVATVNVTLATPAYWAIVTGLPAGAVYDVAAVPDQGQRVYAATTGGVYRSDDGGRTWSFPANTGLGAVAVRFVAPGPSGTGRVVAFTRTSPARVYRSADGGANWSQAFSFSGVGYEMALDRTDGSKGLLSDGCTLYGSADGGASWSQWKWAFPSTTYSVAIDPSDPSVMYAGASFGDIWKSTDGGANWTKYDCLASDTGHCIQSLWVDPGNGDHILAGVTDGVWSTTQGVNTGSTWTKGTGQTSSDVLSIVRHPIDTATFWAATGHGFQNSDGSGVLRTTNGCASWAGCNDGLASVNTYTVAVAGTAGTGCRVLVAASDGLFHHDLLADGSRARRQDGPAPRLRARCAGLEAEFVLTPDMKSGALGTAPGVLPDAGKAVSVREDGQPAGSEHPISYGVPTGSPLRFEPLTAAPGSRAPRHVSRTWEFLLHSLPDEETLLTWPDLSGIGPKERVILEDLDATVRRNMRTSTSYAFRGESRRFRVTAEKRSGAALLITELAVEGAGRGSARVARVTLSAEADLDLDLISPTGALLAEIARAKPLPAGTSRIPWRADLPPGLYLLRARARGTDATVVQSVRPVVVVR